MGLALSIAITTHNRQEILARCLDQLWRSSARDRFVEVIVVDDGSTDDTPAFLGQCLRDGTVHQVLRNDQARGPAQGRNRALDAAKAPFTLITGDDVLFFDDAIDKFLAHLSEHDMSCASVLGNIRPYPERLSAFEWWSSNGGSQFGHSRITESRRFDIGDEYFYTCNVVVPTALLREHRFNERFRWARYEDRELAYRLARKVGHKLHYRSDVGSYHLHPMPFHRWLGAFGRFTEAALLFCELHPEAPELREKVGATVAAQTTQLDAAGLRLHARTIAEGYRDFREPVSIAEADAVRASLGVAFRAVQEHFRRSWFRRHLALSELRDPQTGITAWELAEELLSAIPADA